MKHLLFTFFVCFFFEAASICQNNISPVTFSIHTEGERISDGSNIINLKIKAIFSNEYYFFSEENENNKYKLELSIDTSSLGFELLQNLDSNIDAEKILFLEEYVYAYNSPIILTVKLKQTSPTVKFFSNLNYAVINKENKDILVSSYPVRFSFGSYSK